MRYVTPDLCDAYPDLIQVVEPLFSNFGGCESFGGQIVTIKCFEDNSYVKERVEEDGSGKVMVVDGGGSMRCALLGDMLAETNLGIQALASHPRKSEKRGVGQCDIPLVFGGVTFEVGHYLYADNNGIIVSSQRLEMPGE